MRHYIYMIALFLACINMYGKNNTANKQILSCSEETQRVYLSGTGSDDTRMWEFYCSDGQNSRKWKKIAVPSCWEQQGFGAYTYGRFYKTKGLSASSETGHYRTRFSIPKEWKRKVIRMVFEGVMTDAKVLIDGKQIGAVHQGGFTEFSYTITPFVKPGEKHLLEVLVGKESANKSVNSAERRADWWLFGGIYRPVYMEALPQNHIGRVAIDARADGKLYVQFPDNKDINVANDVIFCIDGKNVLYDVNAGCYDCGDVTTWDPEHPNLHNVTFTLKDGGHTVAKRVGFRTIEFRRHDGIYLNGTRLVVKGINRHCFHPETGRTTNKTVSVQDAQIIKGMNMNAVRCHYPSDNHFLEICDSVGLLYLCELPGWQTHYDDTTATKMVQEMVYRDVNHPSVFLWSNGNEGGWNTCVDSLFAKYDPQHRKVIHPWADYDGIDTHHYPAYQTGAYRLHQGDNVFMPTEFLHSKYDKGGGASLDDMWSHWLSSPLFAGGFIWAYMDEAIKRTDMKGLLDSDGGNGPDGVINSSREPEGSYYAIREVWSPIKIRRFVISSGFDGRIVVENNWLYSRLSECEMTYSVSTEEGRIIESGDVLLPDIAPGESSHAVMPVNRTMWDGEILSLCARVKRTGEVICEWSFPIHRADQYANIDLSGMQEIDAPMKLIPVGVVKFDDVKWYRLRDGRYYLDIRMLYDERTAALTDESKWQVGISIDYPETEVDSVRWMGRGPYRVWRNRLQGQQFGVWSLAYNNTITGQYNSFTAPAYPEFKGYRSDMRWLEVYRGGEVALRVTSLTEGLYFRLFTPEEAIDMTPGEMGGIDEGKKKQERTMIPFPSGDISFLLSIPPMRSYKPLEQLGPAAQPDVIRIKSGDEGFRMRLVFSSLP